MANDSIGISKYVPGGRAYFEADTIGPKINSFTAKGFFDQSNYVEPPPEKNYTL